MTLLPIRTSVAVPPWETTNITLLGDAIHSMTPFRGIGANTALRDAQLLGRNLIAAARGEVELVAGIHDYETQMIDYGFAAVRASLRTARADDLLEPGRPFGVQGGAACVLGHPSSQAQGVQRPRETS